MSENPVRESEPKSKNPQVAERESTLTFLPQVSPSKYALPGVTMVTLSLPQADHMHTLAHSHIQ